MFGSSLRLPATLLSDDPVDRVMLADDPSTEMARAMKVREEAQRALFRMSDARALSAAARARPRRQPQEDLRPNDV
eukprot:14827391-Alexandrium_andersonii.AAC.1